MLRACMHRTHPSPQMNELFMRSSTAITHMVHQTRAVLMSASSSRRRASRKGMLDATARAEHVSGQSVTVSARADVEKRRSEARRVRSAVRGCASLSAAAPMSAPCTAASTASSQSQSWRPAERPSSSPVSATSTAAPSIAATRDWIDGGRFSVSLAGRASRAKAVPLLGSHHPSVLWLKISLKRRARTSHLCVVFRMPGLTSVM